MAIKHLDAESAPLLLQVAILSLLAFLRYTNERRLLDVADGLEFLCENVARCMFVTICAYKLFFIV